MDCPNCGEELDEGASFCSFCGESVEEGVEVGGEHVSSKSTSSDESQRSLMGTIISSLLIFGTQTEEDKFKSYVFIFYVIYLIISALVGVKYFIFDYDGMIYLDTPPWAVVPSFSILVFAGLPTWFIANSFRRIESKIIVAMPVFALLALVLSFLVIAFASGEMAIIMMNAFPSFIEVSSISLLLELFIFVGR